MPGEAWVPGDEWTRIGYVSDYPALYWGQTTATVSDWRRPWNTSSASTSGNSITFSIRDEIADFGGFYRPGLDRQGADAARHVQRHLNAREDNVRATRRFLAGRAPAGEAQERIGALRARQTAAHDRARETLLAVLSPAQRAQYERERVFEVTGSHGGRYRIRPGSMGNVDHLDPLTGEVTGRLCAHPRLFDGIGDLPDPDVALAQMLHLMTDEPGWVATANVHAGRRPELVGVG